MVSLIESLKVKSSWNRYWNKSNYSSGLPFMSGNVSRLIQDASSGWPMNVVMFIIIDLYHQLAWRCVLDKTWNVATHKRKSKWIVLFVSTSDYQPGWMTTYIDVLNRLMSSTRYQNHRLRAEAAIFSNVNFLRGYPEVGKSTLLYTLKMQTYVIWAMY